MLKKQVPVGELRYGMYVAELDRPWTDTPFVFQGFVLEAEEELETQKLLDLSRGHKLATGEPHRIKRTLEYGKAGVSAEALFKA